MNNTPPPDKPEEPSQSQTSGQQPPDYQDWRSMRDAARAARRAQRDAWRQQRRAWRGSWEWGDWGGGYWGWRRGGWLGGAILIVLGLIFLLQNLFNLNWGLVLPILLILAGLALLLNVILRR